MLPPGRLYEINNTMASAITAGRTLIHVTAGAANPLYILEAHVEGESATSLQMEVEIAKVTTAGSPVGTGTTTTIPRGHAAAASFTAIGSLSTEPTAYSATAIAEKHFRSSVYGYHFEPVMPGLWLPIPAGEIWGLRLLTASVASQKFSSSLLVLELG